ncbi:MAG: class I SAM-dependent methyltransferase [Bryobacteraceae bacterium]|jgi:SAM-dependent methyltransferase
MTYPYRWLAENYDALFEPMRDPLHAARRDVLGPILPNVESACDLACGTGTTALELARQGIRMFAVDLSARMCRIAREKARRAGMPLRVIQADMRNFRLPRPVDLITCEFDAINHVPRRADLRRVAQSAARALTPGGWFFFDVNNAAGFKRYWSGNFWIEKPGVVVVMRNGHSPAGDKAWSDIESFVRGGKHWQRHHERVQEVCWKAGEIRTALRAAGFDRMHSWDAAPYFEPGSITRRGCRTIWLARKSRATKRFPGLKSKSHFPHLT